MEPVVRVAEMAAIDAEATESVDVLVERAGRAVARAALELLGGAYGRRVVVVAGRGNNGADGRVAARMLERRGVRCTVIAATEAPARLPDADLVIDAAYGTGLSRPYHAPDPGDAAVLAVDIPSGLDGDTGEALGRPVTADVTVTFAAAKPGLFLAEGPIRAGHVRVADIGLDVSRATISYVDDAAAAARLPVRPIDAHKWSTAVVVVGGSPGMTGAPAMTAAAAMRSGAGMVQVVVPGETDPPLPVEVVAVASDSTSWVPTVMNACSKAQAVVVGPGLGTSMVDRHQVRDLLVRDARPIVVDGSGLTALGDDAVEVLQGRLGPTVLTPHDGEFARLTDGATESDRLGSTQQLAIRTGAIVVRKGPTTVIAAPTGELRLVASGDQRLATAGTGDVLSGIIAALLAADLAALDAAAVGAHLHGMAGQRCSPAGTVASDVIAAIGPVWSMLVGGPEAPPGSVG